MKNLQWRKVREHLFIIDFQWKSVLGHIIYGNYIVWREIATENTCRRLELFSNDNNVMDHILSMRLVIVKQNDSGVCTATFIFMSDIRLRHAVEIPLAFLGISHLLSHHKLTTSLTPVFSGAFARYDHAAHSTIVLQSTISRKFIFSSTTPARSVYSSQINFVSALFTQCSQCCAILCDWSKTLII